MDNIEHFTNKAYRINKKNIYRKLVANVIRTWQLQSPSDDLSFVVT